MQMATGVNFRAAFKLHCKIRRSQREHIFKRLNAALKERAMVFSPTINSCVHEFEYFTDVLILNTIRVLEF